MRDGMRRSDAVAAHCRRVQAPSMSWAPSEESRAHRCSCPSQPERRATWTAGGPCLAAIRNCAGRLASSFELCDDVGFGLCCERGSEARAGVDGAALSLMGDADRCSAPPGDEIPGTVFVSAHYFWTGVRPNLGIQHRQQGFFDPASQGV